MAFMMDAHFSPQMFSLAAGTWETEAELQLARDLVRTWRLQGVLQLGLGNEQRRLADRLAAASRRFFALPGDVKAGHVNDLGYSGFLPVTGGESFFVCQDVAANDLRVQVGWPCHGPVPWPDAEFRLAAGALMRELAVLADRVLRGCALALGWLDAEVLAEATCDGWHHLRALHATPWPEGLARPAPPRVADGLLVAAWSDDQPGLVSVWPGELLHLLTRGWLLSAQMPVQMPAPASPALSLVYCHEPHFNRALPLPLQPAGAAVHGGAHFTRRFMRRHPAHPATLRIRREGRLAQLDVADHALVA